MPSHIPTRRLLRSGLLDLLVGPHGIDRYLELIRPEITVHDARARVTAVRRQTARSVTLTLRPNAAFEGFSAGQFLRVGVEIGGVRRTRTYSPASSEHRADGLLELTVTVHPEGLVSRYLHSSAAPGMVLHLGAAQGEFVLGNPRPQRLVLISGGSGITPLISMLRTLCEEGHDGELTFVHYARTEADWLYRAELRKLAGLHPNLRVEYVATREGGARVSRRSIEHVSGRLDDANAAVCGPPALIESVRGIWPDPGRVRAETFTAPTARLNANTDGTIRFLRSEISAAIGGGTLLEQAEAAGLRPDFGCRMGICHTCTCRKAAGPIRNILTGELSDEEDEDIQLCISAPAGDVALEL